MKSMKCAVLVEKKRIVAIIAKLVDILLDEEKLYINLP